MTRSGSTHSEHSPASLRVGSRASAITTRACRSRPRLLVVVIALIGLLPNPNRDAALHAAPPEATAFTDYSATATATARPLSPPDNAITPRQRAGKLSPARSSGSATSGAGSWGSTLGSLGFVIALLLVAAYVLRKHTPAGRARLPDAVLQPLGRRPLDARNSIQLVRCGSRILVLGSSLNGLTTLAEITDPVEVDYLAGLCQPVDSEHSPLSFDQLLNRFRPTPAPDTATVEDAATQSENSRPSRGRTTASDDVASQRLKQRLHQSAAPHTDSGPSGYRPAAVAADASLEQAHA